MAGFVSFECALCDRLIPQIRYPEAGESVICGDCRYVRGIAAAPRHTPIPTPTPIPANIFIPNPIPAP